MVNTSGPEWRLSSAVASFMRVVPRNEVTPPDPSIWRTSLPVQRNNIQCKATKPCSCQPICHSETMLWPWISLQVCTHWSYCMHLSPLLTSQNALSCRKGGQYTDSSIPTDMGVQHINLLSRDFKRPTMLTKGGFESARRFLIYRSPLVLGRSTSGLNQS